MYYTRSIRILVNCNHTWKGKKQAPQGREILLWTHRVVVLLLRAEVPLPLQDGLAPLPQSEEHLGPDAHEHGEEDGGKVVEDVGELDEGAGVFKRPVRTVGVALRAHRRVAGLLLVANLISASMRGPSDCLSLCQISVKGMFMYEF